jgi:hypothetical protein
LSEDDEYDEERERHREEEEREEQRHEEEERGEQDSEETRSVVKEITDYEEGKTTYLYDDGTYEVVHHDDEEESGCFVATACYGSALDEHVVFLRRFRDFEVMETNIGRCFMGMFNALYYSFSPSLASYLRRHRGAKIMVRYAMVAPTIHLLRVSRYLTKPMSKVSREASIVATGSTFVLMWFIICWILFYLIS